VATPPGFNTTEVWADPVSLAATQGLTICFLLLGLLRCFNSPGSLHRPYVFRPGYQRITTGGFPHSDIPGSMDVWLLPGAFRSLQRPSSAPSAKASTVRPSQLGIDARARYGVSKVLQERGHAPYRLSIPGQKKSPVEMSQPAGRWWRSARRAWA
jgi:hypothetical protein